MHTQGVSIVIPAFNEHARLPATLDRLLSRLDTIVGPKWEVVVSDDGSTDDTAAVVRDRAGLEPRLVLVREDRNAGKGAALVRGVESARYESVVLLDADLPVAVDTIAHLVAASEARVHLVVGSRRLPGSRILRRQPFHRRVGGTLYLAATRALGYRAVSDPQCGVKLLHRDAVGPLLRLVECRGYAFDIELIERVRQAGLTVAEVPLEWSHVPGSAVRPFRDATATLGDLASLRRRIRPTGVATVAPPERLGP